jgi:hypothetical protein
MNLVCNIESFQLMNICFLDTKKNIVMDGNFTKIIYTDTSLTLNGIYINCYLDINEQKYFIQFSIYNMNNINIIQNLSRIEREILDYYKEYFNIKKQNIFLLHEQLKQGNVKIYRERSTGHSSNGYVFVETTKPNIIMKISGIWENTYSIGLTYKFIYVFTK